MSAKQAPSLNRVIIVLLNSFYNKTLYCIVLYCTVLYCTVLYCAVLYCTG
jgi:hypothetical protein